MTIAGWSKKEKPRPARTGGAFIGSYSNPYFSRFHSLTERMSPSPVFTGEPVVTSVSPLKESFCVRVALSKVGDAP